MAIEGSLFFYALVYVTSSCWQNLTKSYFWCRIPIDVRVKATHDLYCPISFLICLGILFAMFFNLIWEFETSTLLIIGVWWLLI